MKKVIRRFKDMKDRFKNPKGIKGNPIIYTVHERDLPNNMEQALTVMNPGTINGEYYMTKGHRHNIATKEKYILKAGKGKLMLQGKLITRIINMKKGKTYTISGKVGHRLINVGNTNLKVLTIYPKTAGHNYKFKFKKRVMKK